MEPRYTDLQRHDGALLRVWEWAGRGTPCVLLHGLGESAHLWRSLASAIAPAYRVVAPDLRGHGDSAWDPRGEYWIATHAADVMQMLDALQIERAALVGHSLGAEVAMHIAAAHSDRLAALVIVDAGPHSGADDVQDIEAKVRESIASRLQPYASVEAYETLLHQIYPLAVTSVIRELASPSLRRRADGRFDVKYDPALGTFTGDTELPWTLLAGIRCPVLVIRGSGSAVLAPHVAERMVRLLPDARLSIVRKAGHTVMLDNPTEFEAAVRVFLERVSRWSDAPCVESCPD